MNENNCTALAHFVGNESVFAIVARPLGGADNGNQYWISVHDGQNEYEALIIGDWEFHSFSENLALAVRAGLFESESSASTLPSIWTCNGEAGYLSDTECRSNISFLDLWLTREKSDHFRFGLVSNSSSQKIVVHSITQGSFCRGALREGISPTVELSVQAIDHLRTALDAPGTKGIGLIGPRRRDWLITDENLYGNHEGGSARPLLDPSERLDYRPEQGGEASLVGICMDVFQAAEYLARSDSEYAEHSGFVLDSDRTPSAASVTSPLN